MLDSTAYSQCRHVALGFDDALARTRTALAAEGFGVLCEIDVQASMRDKLGIARDPYTILGACDPSLAHRALEAEPQLGVLLPCNVVVFVEDAQTYVSAISAQHMLGMVGNSALAPIASEVGARLERAIGHVVAEPAESEAKGR